MNHSIDPSRRPGRAFPLLTIAVLLALTGSACLTSSSMSTGRTVPATEMSPKLNPFVFFEDGTVLFAAVDGRAAQYVKEGTIFPLGIGLANQSRKSLTFSRESFILETADGKHYPLVSHEEFNTYYKRSRSDARLADSFTETLAARFTNYTRVSWRFFPFKGKTSTASDSIEMGRLHWTNGYLYFPIPEGGIHGKEFSLLVNAREVPETFVVKFSLK